MRKNPDKQFWRLKYRRSLPGPAPGPGEQATKPATPRSPLCGRGFFGTLVPQPRLAVLADMLSPARRRSTETGAAESVTSRREVRPPAAGLPARDRPG